MLLRPWACLLAALMMVSPAQGFVGHFGIPAANLRRRVQVANVRPVAAASIHKSLSMRTQEAIEKRLELTLGELVKTLVTTCKIGTLCTTMPLREDVDGIHRFGPQSHETVSKWEKDGREYPFGTLVSYLLTPDGLPFMLLANNAAHTRNIAANNRVAIYAQNPKTTGQKGARVTLLGDIAKIVDPKELAVCKEMYADQFPDQAQPLLDERYERFFSMYKLNVKDIYYVSGFGVMSTWVSPADYLKSEADPLAEFSSQLVEDWNKRREKDYQAIFKAFFSKQLESVESVLEPRITFLDRFGINLRFKYAIQTPAGQPQKYDTVEYRLGFRQQALSMEEAQSAMFKVFQEAWERNEGYADDWEDDIHTRLLLKRDGGENLPTVQEPRRASLPEDS